MDQSPQSGFETTPVKNEKNPPALAIIVILALLAGTVFFAFKVIQHKYFPLPETAQDYHFLAKSYISQNKFPEAEKAALQSIKLSSRFYKPYVDLGVVYFNSGDYILALRMFLTALDLVGNDQDDLDIIYSDIAAAYQREGMAEDSCEYYSKAYQVRGVDQRYWLDPKATLLKFVRENDREGFVSCLNSDANRPKEVYKRENAVRQNLYRDYEKVISDCQKYLEDNPGSKFAYLFHSLLATSYSGIGEYGRAIEILRFLEGLNLPPSYAPWIKDTYAYIAEKRGDYESAKAILQEILQNYPDYYSIKEVRSRLSCLGQRF